LQLGECNENVFNVGAIGLDNIYQLPLLDRESLEASLQLNLSQPVILVTYHPVTLEQHTSVKQMRSLLDSLERFQQGQIVFTMPNADAGGREIIQLIKDFVAKTSPRASMYASLGQLRYLSLMCYSAVVVGNSSSGIIETPSFGIPTINIGDRQKGRVAADSVIHVEPETSAILNALYKAFDSTFLEQCKVVDNPYGKGGVTKKIITVLREKLGTVDLKKEFVDRI
jgi:UDP-hydrolysing UDP-N-acetyl-D-glucosamine 2-epimerase